MIHRYSGEKAVREPYLKNLTFPKTKKVFPLYKNLFFNVLNISKVFVCENETHIHVHAEAKKKQKPAIRSRFGVMSVSKAVFTEPRIQLLEV